MGPKCNIDSIAGAALMHKMSPYLDWEEERQFLSKFKPYVFYETCGTRNMRECYCTTCGSSFTTYKDVEPAFFNRHHNHYAHCPNCGAEAELKCLSKLKSGAGLRSSLPAAFIRPAGEGAISISAGIGFREFNLYNGEMAPQLEYIEKARYYISPGRVKGWKRFIGSVWYRNMYGVGNWQEMVNITEPFSANHLYGWDSDYWLFGTEYLETSALKYSMVEDWYNEATACWLCEQDTTVKLVISYLAWYAMRPQMEMAVKMGLPGVCTDLCEGIKNHKHINWKAKRPWEFLRMDKQDAKIFLRQPSMAVLKAYHISRKQGAKANMEDLARTIHAIGEYHFEDLTQCAAICDVSLHKALDYVQQGPGPAYSRLGEWKDYLDMAAKLGYDMTAPGVLMPHNLTERHDAAAQIIKGQQTAIARKAYRARYKKLKDKYEFEYDGLRIVIPADAEDIVREGNTLHHCVAGYAPRHLEGKTTILFLRKARTPGRSFLTIELSGAFTTEIRQIHGYKNEMYKNSVSPRTKYKDFLDTWLKWVKAGSKRDDAGKPILKKEVNAA